MKTDTELVITAGEKLLGWEVIYPRTSGSGAHDVVVFKRPDACSMYWWPGCESNNRVWNPLTSMSDAGMLIEAMWAKGWDGELQWYQAKSAPGFADGARMYRARFAEIENQENCVLQFSPCAPRAVTLASLEALGVEL